MTAVFWLTIGLAAAAPSLMPQSGVGDRITSPG